MNSYNTRYRQRWVGKRMYKSHTSTATGKDITQKWDTRAGEENKPIAGIGDSLAILEQRLAAITP